MIKKLTSRALLPLLAMGAGQNLSVGKHRYIVASGGGTPTFVTGNSFSFTATSGTAQNIGFTVGAGDFIVLTISLYSAPSTISSVKLGSTSMSLGGSLAQSGHGALWEYSLYDSAGGDTTFTMTYASCNGYVFSVGILEFSSTSPSIAASGTFVSNITTSGNHSTCACSTNYSPSGTVLAVGLGSYGGCSTVPTAQAATTPWSSGTVYTSTLWSTMSVNLMYQLSTSSATAAAGTYTPVETCYVRIMTGGVPVRQLAILFALLLLVASSAAQTPAQFSGLLTNSTDLTCAGVADPACSTWPMPANPGMGNSYHDPTWGTTTWELPVGAANTAGHVIPTYARIQGFNSNNTRLFMSETPGYAYLDLYDATTTPPTFINRITTTDGTGLNSYNGDALWANTVPTRIYYVPWTGAYAMQLRYVDVSTCTTSSCVLTPTIVHSFSCTSDFYFPGGAGVNGNQIETGSGAQGGMFDSTDTYFSFTCDCVPSGTAHRGEIDLIRYNKSIDTVTTQVKWYTVCKGGVPSGCGVWTNSAQWSGPQGYNMIRMNQHPNANYIEVGWQCATDSNSAWEVGCGAAAYGPTWNFLGPISVGDYHSDNGFDINGVPVWVGYGTFLGTSADFYSLEVVNLTTLSTSGITSKQLQLPCPYAYTGTPCPTHPFLASKQMASHVSMTGTWGSVPGYALFSTMTMAGVNNGYNVDFPLATRLGTTVSSAGEATVTPGSMANIATGTQQLIDFLNTYIAANVATGSQTVTPESMIDISTGQTLVVGGETVTVTGTTASTFTATFATALTCRCWISSPNMETVTVTGTTPSTFTATFAHPHISTALISNLSVGDTGPYAMENIAVKIDTTAASGSTASVWRLGRAMSIRDADYNAEPHTFVNRNWTAYVWGSNWNTDGGVDNAYYTQLSSSAPAPVCLFQDVVSGQASGGEGGNGVYVTITGKNLGTSGTIKINGTAVAQTFNWGAADVTGNYQTVGMQVASGTTSGSIVLTTSGGSCSNLSFTVRSGSIWYYGLPTDSTTISSPTCAQLKADTVPGDVGNGGTGTYTNPWKFTNAVNVDTYSTQNNTYTWNTARTPYTYYNCISAGDTIVFLNGFSFIYGDGYNLHSSFNLNLNKGASGTPLVIEARPGAAVQLGSMGAVAFGIRDDSDTNYTISGISATGSGSTSGSAIAGNASTSGTNPPNERIVGNILTCPDCDGSSAVLEAGWDAAHETITANAGIEILGNWVYNAGCSDGAGVSDKQYHFIYTNGNGEEIAWNKIGGTGATAGCAQNGIQVNYYKDDNTVGFGNYSIHDNDISYSDGSGINLATVDLTSGPVSVYNNVIHHTGVIPSSSGGSFFDCVSLPAYGPTAGTGTVNVYNNTLYDCAYYLNTANTYITASGAFYVGSGQSGMVLKLTNNIAYQPTYTYTSSSANLFVSGPGTSTVSGNNNLWYTASSCATGCLTIPNATGTVTNPLMVSPSAGNFALQSTSPAIGAGSASLYPTLDFAGYMRPNPPAIGALEYEGTVTVTGGISGAARLTGKAGVN